MTNRTSFVSPYKSIAERAEEIAAGRTGKACPFCLRETATITTTRDRRGVLDQTWACENCDESGVVLPGGVLHWEPGE
jgi:hypothetical protein